MEIFIAISTITIGSAIILEVFFEKQVSALWNDLVKKYPKISVITENFKLILL